MVFRLKKVALTLKSYQFQQDGFIFGQKLMNYALTCTFSIFVKVKLTLKVGLTLTFCSTDLQKSRIAN
jgi:hypothetical protein